MQKIAPFILIFVITMGMITIGKWLFSDPTVGFVTNEPGMDRVEGALAGKKVEVNIGEHFEVINKDAEIKPSTNWPRFRGSDYDNISKQNVQLANSWPEEGPKICWKINLGEGHSAPVVSNGKLLILDYDEEKKADALRCFALHSGKELWKRWYKIPVKRNHGLSRTVPAIWKDYVVTIGPKCHTMCTRISDGTLVWSLDLVKEYETEVPLWYTGQCPLIDNGVVVLAPGNKALLIGVDVITGKVLWRTNNPNKIRMSHSSVMPTTFYGKKMYVYCGLGGLSAVSAEQDDLGKLQWFTKKWSPNVIAPSPLFLPHNQVLVTAGYGAGGALYEIKKNGEAFEVEELKHYSAKEGLASEQQTPLLYKNHLLTIHPKDAGGKRNQLACYDINNVNTPVWMSGKEDRFGLGPYLIADGKIIVLNDNGELYLIRADVTKYERLAKHQIIDGVDAWGPLVLVDGLLLMRDAKTMVCVDLK